MNIHVRQPSVGSVDILVEGRELGAVLSDVFTRMFQLLLELKAMQTAIGSSVLELQTSLAVLENELVDKRKFEEEMKHA